MAFTQDDLDALKGALATGVMTVEYQGKRTTFRSVQEIERIIAVIEGELSPATAAPATTAGVYDSGLQPFVRKFYGRCR